MNKTDLISLLALLILVVGLAVYAVTEPARLQEAQASLREQYVQDGAGLYVDYCALCHGSDGAGVGFMPAINHPALNEAEDELLFRTIARAAHGSTMAAWHIEEGGVLNDFQIQQLVSLIKYADWQQVEAIAQVRGFEQPPETAAEVGLAYLEVEDAADPHYCAACHEEPTVHIDKFGLNCARCHSTVVWTPATLTKHTFLLDHGGQGQVDCETCHVENYYEHTCYECHDHQPDQMKEVHLAEKISDYANCVECHPTGVEGEAQNQMDLLLGKLDKGVIIGASLKR